ncbi:GAF domain-containing protein [Kamptonema cortianum]|nr:GAF domain-containing protein [Kamptonema cortianum]
MRTSLPNCANSNNQCSMNPQLPSSEFDWLAICQHSRRLLMAVVEPNDFKLQFANAAFCHLAGIQPLQGVDSHSPTPLLSFLSTEDRLVLRQLYQRHVFYQMICQLQPQLLQASWMATLLNLIEEPIVVALTSPTYSEPRFIQFWLNSERLHVESTGAQADRLIETAIAKGDSAVLQAALMGKKALRLEGYRISGSLLLEGLDVTDRETIRQLTQLLINRDSILTPKKFNEVNRLLRSLFQANNVLILRSENTQAQISLGTAYDALEHCVYSMSSLKGSHFLRAAKANQVQIVGDLSTDCPTDCEAMLLQQGWRSLLLIPLGVATAESSDSGQLLGLVALLSDRPNQFTPQDTKNASELILALTSALRQASQQQFAHIHPAVAWRFLQEAERRSWGLLPQPIIFANVYPLYGISDIRGSSQERNRAIQADLIEQFRLGLAIVEAVCQSQDTALGKQLQQDLLSYIKRLEEKITVDAEITAIQYLKAHLEIYFDYFAQCSEAAKTAVEAYRQACKNVHQCVYQARSQYDRMVNEVNTQLQQTWDRWQMRMQKISPHYCDCELTDGIDHMIYTGASIDPKFTPFHLHSLRYEQLRAVCECARTALKIQAQYDTQLELTHLVLAQDITVDIIHDEKTEKTFDVRGTRDTRYEIVKKRIDKALDSNSRDRITQPRMLTIVYSTEEEWQEYQQYLQYLIRESWLAPEIESGAVESLQGVEGLKFARVRILPENPQAESL